MLTFGFVVLETLELEMSTSTAVLAAVTFKSANRFRTTLLS